MSRGFTRCNLDCNVSIDLSKCLNQPRILAFFRRRSLVESCLGHFFQPRHGTSNRQQPLKLISCPILLRGFVTMSSSLLKRHILTNIVSASGRGHQIGQVMFLSCAARQSQATPGLRGLASLEGPRPPPSLLSAPNLPALFCSKNHQL